MKRDAIRLVLLVAAVGWLTACAPTEETAAALPTALPEASLPTAIPPEGETSVWAVSFVYEFPASFWQLGQHQYGFYMDCPELGQVESGGDWRFFQVTNAVPSFEAPIFLRLGGLSTGVLAPINVDAIHPDQVTVAVITILGVTEEQALNAADSAECEIIVGWDGVQAQTMAASPPFQP